MLTSIIIELSGTKLLLKGECNKILILIILLNKTAYADIIQGE